MGFCGASFSLHCVWECYFLDKQCQSMCINLLPWSYKYPLHEEQGKRLGWDLFNILYFIWNVCIIWYGKDCNLWERKIMAHVLNYLKCVRYAYDIEKICNLLERKIMNATFLASPIISLSKGKLRNVALGFELLYQSYYFLYKPRTYVIEVWPTIDLIWLNWI